MAHYNTVIANCQICGGSVVQFVSLPLLLILASFIVICKVPWYSETTSVCSLAVTSVILYMDSSVTALVTASTVQRYVTVMDVL